MNYVSFPGDSVLLSRPATTLLGLHPLAHPVHQCYGLPMECPAPAHVFECWSLSLYSPAVLGGCKAFGTWSLEARLEGLGQFPV